MGEEGGTRGSLRARSNTWPLGRAGLAQFRWRRSLCVCAAPSFNVTALQNARLHAVCVHFYMYVYRVRAARNFFLRVYSIYRRVGGFARRSVLWSGRRGRRNDDVDIEGGRSFVGRKGRNLHCAECRRKEGSLRREAVLNGSRSMMKNLKFVCTGLVLGVDYRVVLRARSRCNGTGFTLFTSFTKQLIAAIATYSTLVFALEPGQL